MCKFTFFVATLIILGFNTNLFSQNNSAHFNGTTGNISVPSNSSLDLSTNFTIEAWVKLESNIGTYAIINKAWCGISEFGYSLAIESGKVAWKWNPASSGGSCTYTNAVSSNNVIFTGGDCHHIAVVHAPSYIQIYVDGILVPSTIVTGSYSAVNVSSEPLLIGAYKAIAGNLIFSVVGEIDEVRIWDSPRSSLNINTYYNQALSVTEMGLILYYNFNNEVSIAGGLVDNIATTGNINNGMQSTTFTPLFSASCETLPNLGITETQNKINSFFSIAPNPGSEEIKIQLTDFEAIKEIHLFNAFGSEISMIEPKLDLVSISTSQLAQGIYYVTVKSIDGTLSTQKWVKSN